MELGDLYSDAILTLAANAPQPARLVEPSASVRRVSRICGSVIEVDLAVAGGVVTAYGHAVSACVLGQTASAVMAREVVGSSVADLRALREQMTAMLKSGGAPPSGRWSDLALLEPVRDYPGRHQSTLLVFDAVVEALDKIESVTELAAKT